MSRDHERHFLKFKLGSSLQVGRQYVLRLGFIGWLVDGLNGLYRSSYTEGNQTKWLATTQFQATDARKAFPCFDEPALKATFTTTLCRKSPMRSLSNMPIRTTETRAGGWLADRYEKTVKMSTYLLAFIVCDFRYKEKATARGTRFRVWSRPMAIQQTSYALDTGVAILTYFEDYFNITFPLPKQDMIAIPDFSAGAMENWGLITYRETALLYDPAMSSASNKQRIAIVVSHELAHQWFGNLVTPSWWDDLWLNEGFASYVEYLGVDFVHPDWKMKAQFVTEDMQDVFKADGLGTSHPIFIPVYHPDQINEIFDRISYGKGAAVIRMMNYFLGEPIFKAGLTRYLNSRRYGSAFHDDLWRSLTQQAIAHGKTTNPNYVKEIMDTWILQMGYPVVKLVRDSPSGSQVTATQKHYLFDYSQPPSSKHPSPFGYKWEIPLTYVTNVNPTWNGQYTWMKKGGVTLNIPPTATWILGNFDLQGYFRVNYDTNNWNRLIQQLKINHRVFTMSNRAQIIDDAFNLGRSGDIDQLVGMRTTEYLNQETDYVPWQSAATNLNYVNKMLGRSYAYGEFQKYMLKRYIPLYNHVGWTHRQSDPHLTKYLRIIALGGACKYGYHSCLGNASRLYQRWMADPVRNAVTADFKSIVYCNGLRMGGAAEWDFAYSQMQNANVASEKSRLMYALSCTKVPWLLSRFMNYTMDKTKLRKQDAIYVMGYVSRNPIGRSIAWNFVRANFDAIRRRYAGSLFAFTKLIDRMTEPFNTEFELTDVRRIVQAHSDALGSGVRAFKQAIEKTKTNIKWRQLNEDKIYRWLQSVNTN